MIYSFMVYANMTVADTVDRAFLQDFSFSAMYVCRTYTLTVEYPIFEQLNLFSKVLLKLGIKKERRVLRRLLSHYAVVQYMPAYPVQSVSVLKFSSGAIISLDHWESRSKSQKKELEKALGSYITVPDYKIPVMYWCSRVKNEQESLEAIEEYRKDTITKQCSRHLNMKKVVQDVMFDAEAVIEEHLASGKLFSTLPGVIWRF